ncbi:hypothetical protein [Paenibacillus solanacearum]|uniref:hypothetical protein n=1 Tax=Paenibacillus solanacearum TaxID=2048548 RepID=UPI001C407ACA|nr:hypothetical protein [Paenibacillus solanacearum]
MQSNGNGEAGRPGAGAGEARAGRREDLPKKEAGSPFSAASIRSAYRSKKNKREPGMAAARKSLH